MKFVRAALICGALALVALVAAGCGSSSGSGSTSTQASASAGAGAAGNRQQIADCLKKQGITLPQRRPGSGTRPPNAGGTGNGGGFFFFGGGGGGQGAQGANSGRFAKVQAALKKCGINPQRSFRGGGRFQANSAKFKAALSKFTACVRKNGYDLPKPNTSGKGPVFDASKVNRNDPKFKTAAAKCQKDLQALRPQGPPGGAPPAQN
jgi:hypothetical protein